MRHPAPTTGRVRWLLLVFVVGLTASLLAPTGAIATAAHPAAETSSVPTGPLALEPHQGDTETPNIRLVTAQLCPESATNYLVRIAGAGFAPGSNAIGNESVENLSRTTGDKGLAVPMWGTWQMVAEAYGIKEPLNGVAKLTMVCMSKFGHTVYAANIGEVKFSAQGAKKPSTYSQLNGPRLHSGQPVTADDIAAIARNDGSFPPPDEGAVEIVEAPAPVLRGSPAATETGAGNETLADTGAGAPVKSQGESDVPSDAAAPDDAQPDLSATSSSGGGRGGLSTAAMVSIALLLVLIGAGGLMFRATRSE